jgi:glycosyltransferase involved in cell wall biosynthesis
MFKPRLLLINGAQFGYSSGHYFYCKYLLENYSISYICYDRGNKRIILEGVDVVYVSYKGSKIFRTLRLLKKCIKFSFNIKPQLLIVTYFDICFILALFCKSKKTILDIRTGSLKGNIIISSIDNLLIQFQSLFFNKVIILSASLCKKLHISVKKSNIIPLGSEIFFSGNHSYDTLKLLYVGSLDDRNIVETIKGIQIFLQKNQDKKTEILYTIVGFGSEQETLKIINSISDTKLFDYVKFVGRKNYEELAYYFEQSNIGIAFVPQTKWYDCQPVTKLFEYMLSGMPVIATNTFENRLIVNTVNGVLINDTAEDFCNGLMRIVNQRNSFNSSDIRKSVESYTWANIINTKLKPFLEESVN